MNIHACSQQKSHKTSGFTLVEVLVASAILALGLLGVATMIARSTIQDARAYHMTHASLMVEEAIESIGETQWRRLSYQNMAEYSDSRVINGVNYNMVCTLANNTPMNDCKEMSCTVMWNNKGIQSQTEFLYVFAPKY